MASGTIQVGGFDVLGSLESAFTTLLDYIPRIIGALLVLVVGYIIARLLRAGLTKLFQKLRVDDKLGSGQPGQYLRRFSPDGSPSALLGAIVFWLIMVFVITSAVGTLSIPALTGFMNLVLSYIPNVIAAILILLLAVVIAGAIGAIAQRALGDTLSGRIVRSAGPTLVMVIAVFMILTQLHIAPIIVGATFIAMVSALALGSALAFGLGGRDAAAEMINAGYRRAQQVQDESRSNTGNGPAEGSSSGEL